MEDNNESKYSKSKIYKLVPKVYEGEYIPYYGSTIEQYLSKRLQKHKASYNQFINNKSHFISSFNLFELYGINNIDIILVEDYPCENKYQLFARERYYIENYDCVNKIIPLKSEEEKKETISLWREKNKDYIKEQALNYREKNREKLIDLSKKYYNDNKIDLNLKCKLYQEEHKIEIKNQRKEYRIKNIDNINKKQKEYRIKNIDKILNDRKIFYENNKEKILENQKLKIICECGAEINKNEKSRHMKTDKHNNLINNIQIIEKLEKKLCECGGHYTLGRKERHDNTNKHIEYINNKNNQNQ